MKVGTFYLNDKKKHKPFRAESIDFNDHLEFTPFLFLKCGFLLLIRKSQRLSAQNRKVYRDWRDHLSCSRLVWKAGGFLLCPFPPPPCFPAPILPSCPMAPLAKLPHCHFCSDSWKSKVFGSRHPATHPWTTVRPELRVLGNSWEEQLPTTRQRLPVPGSVQTH